MKNIKSSRHFASLLLRDSSGFTLIEVVISGVIAVVLALGLATLLRNATETEKSIKLKQEAYNLRQEFRYERATSGLPLPDP